jgi:hypothetical protein
MRIGSRIDVPESDEDVGVMATVAGVAWAPAGVSGVEVLVDDGEWAAGSLEARTGPLGWTRWRADVELEPGRHVIRARAIDAAGVVQEAEPLPPHPTGAQGYDRVIVSS